MTKHKNIFAATILLLAAAILTTGCDTPPPPPEVQENVVVYLTDADFGFRIQEGVVLVDFYADWCGPCVSMAPDFEFAARKMEGKVLFAKVDTDANKELVARYGIGPIPALLLFVDGELKDQVVGRQSEEQLLEMVRPYVE